MQQRSTGVASAAVDWSTKKRAIARAMSFRMHGTVAGHANPLLRCLADPSAELTSRAKLPHIGGTPPVQPHFCNNGNMEEKDAIVSLAALAQPARLRIFRALVGAGPEGMTPGTLAATLGVPASTLSFHLKELTYAGLVTQERESRNLFYRPSIARMNDLLAYLTAHCCGGSPCEVAPATACVDC